MTLTDEQKRAYDRYIALRDKIGAGSYGKKLKQKFIPLSEVVCTVDVVGFNHPFFEQNDLYLEYVDAFKQWIAIEPEIRKQERMSMIRGDYGDSDSWRDKQTKLKEI